MPKFSADAPKRDWKLCRSAGALGAAVLALTLSSTALHDVVANGDTRSLSFFHVHSKERLTVTFKVNGRYDEAGLAKINHLLRDWRNHKETRMDPHLFDILWEVVREANAKEPIHIISAYRSPETNSMLRSRSRGVAQFSQHMVGKAIDFHIPDVPLATIREIGLRLQRGGVGFYPSSGSPFVHMDTGSVRHWPRMAPAQLAQVMRKGTIRSDRPIQVASANPAETVRNFVSSIFGRNNPVIPRSQQPAYTPPAEMDDEDEAPAPNRAAPPANTQLADANPNSIPAAVNQPRMRWSVGPQPAPETTGAIPPANPTMAFAPPAENRFPPANSFTPPASAPAAAIAAAHIPVVPFAGKADRAVPALYRTSKLEMTAEFTAPDWRRAGFAQTPLAAIASRFDTGVPDQLDADRFDDYQPVLQVQGFAPAARAAAR